MKKILISDLCACDSCGGEAALWVNARNYFQIRCEKCGRRTQWGRKIEAVINWFNKKTYMPKALVKSAENIRTCII